MTTDLHLDAGQAACLRAELAHMIAATKQHLRDLETLYRHLFPDEHDGLLEDERALIRRGKIIEAIKDIRARTGFGLREAKDVVDRYRGKLGTQP